MNIEEINALERRNTAESRLIHQKLDTICETVKENHRALRGSNGDAGIVADVVILKNKVEDMSDNRKWVNRAVVGATLALIANIIYNLL